MKDMLKHPSHTYWDSSFIEMKTAMSEMKQTTDGINDKLDITEENISELENIAIETM